MTEDAEGSARQLAERHGLRFVDLTQSALAPSAASLLPEDVARRHHAVPIGRRLGTPVIAVSDPGDLFAMDALRASVGREYVAVVARPDQVDRAILHLYTPSEPDAPASAADGPDDDLGSEDSDFETVAQAGLALDQVITPGTDGASGGTASAGHSRSRTATATSTGGWRQPAGARGLLVSPRATFTSGPAPPTRRRRTP